MSLPSNLLESDVPGTWDYRSHPGVSLKAFPDPAAVERAAKLLTTAMRPVLLAGGGAVASGARESLERLADRTGALLATTMQAREWFRGHPRDIGLMGSFATARARDFFGQADLLVAIGTSLNPYIQGTAYGPGGPLAAKAKVIQIDRDPDRINDYQRVELGIVGDAKASVDAILDRLDADYVPGPERAWNVEGGAAELPTPPRSASTSRPAIRDFLEALDPLLPAERTVVVDCGLFVFSLVDQIHCAPESFVWTMNFGSLGMALPMGIGAAVARPNQPCFVFVGDGGFTMSPQELITATNHGIPLTVVILDDGGYGAEAHILKSRQKPLGLAALTNPDLANVARSMGAEAVTVRNLGDLREVERLIGEKRSRPLVIHALVERDAVHRAVP
jgi:thiamine pyrophosphate-dependent acetolactate synthase large subunit-like protein